MIDLIVFAILNITSFFLWGIDKYRFVSERKPLPTAIKVLAVVLGGAFGVLCGMILYKHVTKNRFFRICAPIFSVLQVGIMLLIRYICY